MLQCMALTCEQARHLRPATQQLATQSTGCHCWHHVDDQPHLILIFLVLRRLLFLVLLLLLILLLHACISYSDTPVMERQACLLASSPMRCHKGATAQADMLQCNHDDSCYITDFQYSAYTIHNEVTQSSFTSTAPAAGPAAAGAAGAAAAAGRHPQAGYSGWWRAG